MRDVAIVSAVFESMSDSTKATSRQKVRFRYRSDMVSDKSNYDMEVTSRVRWSNRDIGRQGKSSLIDLRELSGKTSK